VKDVQAVIMAGGKGRRLKPFTTVFPKPLMPIGDVPILDLVLRQLHHFGVREVTITVGYLAELILTYLGDGSQYGLTLHFAHERTPLGTIGPLANIPNDGRTMLVLNGDVLTSLNYQEMLDSHRRSGAAMTLAGYRRPTVMDKGILTVDANNRLTAYDEKPTYHFLVAMGIYLIEPAALARIVPGQPLDAPDLVQRLLADGVPINSFLFDGYWLDIGQPGDYEKALDEFDSRRASLLHEKT
jgi:NDP-sugar pyrophosphorylase family protein